MAMQLDPIQALKQARELHDKLQAFDKLMFTDIHAADIEYDVQLFEALDVAQRKCMVLLGKLLEVNSAKIKSGLGCKVKKGLGNAA